MLMFVPRQRSGVSGNARLTSSRCWTATGKRGDSRDHPVPLNVPETAYLKCAICEVEKMIVRGHHPPSQISVRMADAPLSSKRSCPERSHLA